MLGLIDIESNVDRHFISEKIENNVITSKRQLADILTKALHRPSFHELSSKLGMSNMSSLRGSVENQARQI